MPGLGGHPHHNYDRHLRASREATFGVVNPSPSWQVLPILGDGYKLFDSSPRFVPETNVGGWREQVGIHHQHEIAGAHTMLAWPTPTCFVLSAALDRDADGDVYSYTHDYYSPADPRRALGAVVESLAIRVSGTGDSDVQIEATWRAKRQNENDALSEDDYDYSALAGVPFMFRDARLEINTVHVIDVSAFTLNLSNNIDVGPNVGGYVAYLIAGRREITLDVSKANISQQMADLIRDGGSISFEADFVHPEGHRLQIQLPVLAVETSDEAVSATEIAKESPTLRALAPHGQDIIVGCDLGPTTTTLEPLTTTAAPGPTTTTLPA